MAISPERRNAEMRVHSPISRRPPNTISIAPANQIRENICRLSNIATWGMPKSLAVPCSRIWYATTMRSRACACGVQAAAVSRRFIVPPRLSVLQDALFVERGKGATRVVLRLEGGVGVAAVARVKLL